MAILTPTTELEAVNVMMSHIGESPVNTLEDDNVIDATIAQTVLSSVNREVQSQGWYFNTEIGFPITKDSNNKFAVPVNTARVDGVNTSTSSTHSSLDLVLRGGFMYDRRKHTYTPDATTITVDLVVLLSFTDYQKQPAGTSLSAQPACSKSGNWAAQPCLSSSLRMKPAHSPLCEMTRLGLAITI